MRLLVLVAGLLAFVQATFAGGILAIDYGTEWMKVSLVKPGIPFDVLLNVDSKRKIQSVAAVRGEEKWIGGDAASLASRYPDSSFPSVKLLLGHSTTDPQAQQYETIYRTRLHTDSKTGKATFKDSALSNAADQGGLSHPEEYLALQFSHVKKLAKDAAGGENIVDVVVTVPIFFTQAERQAILDAVELAGLRSLALIDDGSAVAINYAMTRAFPSSAPEHHLFYDAGAGSIKTTIVSFQTAEVKDSPASKYGKNITLAEVKGVGWDRSAGGLLMDAKIRDMLEQQFNEKEGSKLELPLEKNKRAQAKLLKEATRVKQVLSANIESPSRIEGLAEDIDFRGVVTREAFESACSGLVQSYSKPIYEALRSSNMTMDDITSVILVGGVSRVPMVRNAVVAAAGENRIAQNLNADEAAVMGAALYGAALSSQFKTKDIRLTSVTPYGIDLTYEAESKKGITAEAPRLLTSTIFAAQSKTGVKKTMTFKKTTDFPLHFRYKPDKDSQPGAEIANVAITGITEAFANLSESEAANATVKVVVHMTESNMLEVPSAQITLPEVKEQGTVVDTIKGFFGGKDKDKEKESLEASSSSTTSSPAASDTPVPAKRQSGPIALTVSTDAAHYKPLTEQEKKDATKRLRDLDLAEIRKRNREEARNGLEAYLYRLRDLLESSEFIEASTEAERIKIRKQLEEGNEWLWDEGETAPTKDLKSAKGELERSAAPVVARITEAAGRSKAVTEFRVSLITAQGFLISATKQLENDTVTGEPSKYTEAELKTLESTIASNEKWLEELLKKQDALKKNQDPVLRVSELERRKKELSTQVSLLQAKRPPRKAKKSTSTTTTSSSSTATPSTSSDANATESPKAEHPRDEL